MTEPAVLTVAYLLDLVIGDPRNFPHPVRGIGLAIEKTEEMLRKRVRRESSGDEFSSWELGIDSCMEERPDVADAGQEKVMGVFLTVIIVGLTYLVFNIVNTILMNPRISGLGAFLSFVIIIYLVSTTIATRDLLKSCGAVIDAVTAGNIDKARDDLGKIVGRDTKELEGKSILKATIETVSENASDGIVAPLFYFALGGLPLAMTYKAINTLDSMVGYKNKKYSNFGWASARLDDIANYIPARITGFLIVLSAYIIGFIEEGRGHDSLKIMLRDGHKHSSPNSGVPEAAMAGALGVQLGGTSTYCGVLSEKPFIGDEESGTKEEMHKQMYLKAAETSLSIVKITSLLAFGLSLILLFLRTAI